jgi:hypothetical protein
MLASSIQAELDNPYGVSKKAGEELLFRYAKNRSEGVCISLPERFRQMVPAELQQCRSYFLLQHCPRLADTGK